MHNRRLCICMCIVHIIIVRLMWNISYHLQINNSRTYIFISLTTYQQHLNRHKSLWSSVKSQCITHERHINLKLLILIVKKWFSQCFWFPHYCFQFDENKMRRDSFFVAMKVLSKVFLFAFSGLDFIKFTMLGKKFWEILIFWGELSKWFTIVHLKFIEKFQRWNSAKFHKIFSYFGASLFVNGNCASISFGFLF